MPFRYAVLWDIDRATPEPVGVAVEMDGYVLIDVPDEFCIPAKQRGGYDVMQPNATHVTYRPGHSGYFDQVLIDLSSSFAIREQGMVDTADPESVGSLLKEKVVVPLIESTSGSYTARYPAGRYVPEDVPEAPETSKRHAIAV